MVTVADIHARCVRVGDCLVWQGAVDRPSASNPRTLPYGRVNVGGKVDRTHRLVYKLTRGAIPHGAKIRHSCDNPRCCEPDHLVAGTQAENVSDCVSRGRRKSTKGPLNGRAKLTLADVEEIRAAPSSVSNTTLGHRYHVSDVSISYIRSGKTWGDS
jgi:hypothetical protein